MTDLDRAALVADIITALRAEERANAELDGGAFTRGVVLGLQKAQAIARRAVRPVRGLAVPYPTQGTHPTEREPQSGDAVPPKLRLRACVEKWPDCETGEYNPSCCRFPKSCSCDVYDDEFVTPDDLEPQEDQ